MEINQFLKNNNYLQIYYVYVYVKRKKKIQRHWWSSRVMCYVKVETAIFQQGFVSPYIYTFSVNFTTGNEFLLCLINSKMRPKFPNKTNHQKGGEVNTLSFCR